MFKALADPVRLRLLSLITAAEGGEVCVCDLTPGFRLAGPTISHHLKVLREAGLVSGERRGTWIYYRAVPRVAGDLVVEPGGRLVAQLTSAAGTGTAVPRRTAPAWP